jgi:uncharacterized protein YndB with AHSA1/START domain
MKDFKKYYRIPATPAEVYMALTNPLTIELWTGEPAVMSTDADSEFSMWEGSIVGRNLEFEPDKKIVQQWYFDGQPEPSVVTIKLHPDKDATSVELRHINIPDTDYNGFAEGWDNSYFGPLTQFFAEE